jgi:hypothetical protein
MLGWFQESNIVRRGTGPGIHRSRYSFAHHDSSIDVAGFRPHWFTRRASLALSCVADDVSNVASAYQGIFV